MNNSQFFETHCHLDSLKTRSIDETVNECHKVGVNKILTIAVNPENLQVVSELTKKYDSVYGTQGVHPHDARLFLDHYLDEIKNEVKLNSKILAIGEIGLDYHYDFSPKKTQLDVFEKQILLAIDLDLPVVIHSREADDDMMNFLNKYGPKMNRKGILHSFSSSIELAKTALKQNFFLAFNGIATFKMAETVRDTLKITPSENLLFETDSPYLAPTPHRGKENNPIFIPHIANKIAEIRGERDKESFFYQVYQNSLKILRP